MRTPKIGDLVEIIYYNNFLLGVVMGTPKGSPYYKVYNIAAGDFLYLLRTEIGLTS